MAETKEARCDGMKCIMEAPFAFVCDDGAILLDGHVLIYCPWCGGKLCTWENKAGEWQYGGCNPESPDFDCTEGYYDEADRYTVEFPSTRVADCEMEKEGAHACSECKYCPPKPDVGESQWCMHQWLLQAACVAWRENGAPGEACWRFESKPDPVEGQCCGTCLSLGEMIKGVCSEQDIACDPGDGRDCGMYQQRKGKDDD